MISWFKKNVLKTLSLTNWFIVFLTTPVKFVKNMLSSSQLSVNKATHNLVASPLHTCSSTRGKNWMHLLFRNKHRIPWINFLFDPANPIICQPQVLIYRISILHVHCIYMRIWFYQVDILSISPSSEQWANTQNISFLNPRSVQFTSSKFSVDKTSHVPLPHCPLMQHNSFFKN